MRRMIVDSTIFINCKFFFLFNLVIFHTEPLLIEKKNFKDQTPPPPLQAIYQAALIFTVYLQLLTYIKKLLSFLIP